MILASIFVCFCIASAVNYLRIRRQRRLVANLKGPFAWPLVGGMHKIVLLTQKNFFQHSTKYLSKYGALSRCWVFHRLFIPVADLELARQLLQSENHQETGYELMQDWLGGSVSTCKPEQWQQRHEPLAKYFKPEHMQHLRKLLQQQAEQLQLGLQEEAKEQSVCDAWQLVSSQVLQTMLLITCGVQPSEQYKKAFTDLTELYRRRFLSIKSANRFTFWLASPLLRLRQRRLIKLINTENKLLIQQCRQSQVAKVNQLDELKNEGIQIDQPAQPSLLQLLVASETLTDEEVCAELNHCNYLGYLLCSTTLCFALVQIARHPSVQQRCLEELRGQPPGEQTALTFLDAVLHETLRLHPPQLIVGRQLARDFPYTHSVVGDAVLPANAEIYINLYELQRSAEHYGSKSNQFDPERFLTNPPELLSFGLGPRSCPARQFSLLLLKSLLGSILSRYELLPYGDALRPILRLAPASRNGFQLALKPR